jgi:NDP-sugar pyrophosphorylase family protein
MKAIVLAAGKGNRLKPYTDTIPKPLLSLCNTDSVYNTLLTDILTKLPSYIDEVYIIVKHLEDNIREYVEEHMEYFLKQNPYIKNIVCISQTGEKGTMGALLTVKHMIKPDERFLILNGDDLHSKEELEIFNTHNRSFGIHKKIMPGYKSVQVNSEGKVFELRTQTEDEKIEGCYIATGVYLIDGGIFDFPPVVLTDGEIGLPQTLMMHVDEYTMYAVEEKDWVSVNTVEDLERLWRGFGECRFGK